MLIDLHVHTRLSNDSRASAAEYLAAASETGLGGLCFTEHRLYPQDAALDEQYAELSERFGVRIFKGIEADTDLGHLLLFGVTPRLLDHFDLCARMLKSVDLIVALESEGGVAIPAHPFRDSGFGPRLSELQARVGMALRAVEAVNGQNSPAQNQLALAAAAKHGLGATGGSDAHFVTPQWFPTVATEFARPVENLSQMCEELRAGRVRPHVFAM